MDTKNKSIMNTLELEAYKAALAREVLNINNQEVLDTIMKYLFLWKLYQVVFLTLLDNFYS